MKFRFNIHSWGGGQCGRLGMGDTRLVGFSNVSFASEFLAQIDSDERLCNQFTLQLS